jgi:integrase/recombinase XerC
MNYLIETKDLYHQAKTIFDSLDVSENTRKDYCSRIGAFLNFIQKEGFRVNSYLDYKRHLEKRTEYTVSTKNKYLATSKVFLKELNRLGLLSADITQNIKLFSQNKKHKREGLTDREMKKIVDKINELPNTKQHARLCVLFSLLAFQGLRQIEIIRLDVDDVDLPNKRLFVRSKGSDDKEVIYLAPATIEAIKGYLKTNKVGSGALFRSLSNRKSKRLSSMTIKREFQKLFIELNINKTVHGFRHFYVTKLLQSLDVRDVRKFSRHKSLEMIVLYDDEIDMKEKMEDVFACFEEYEVIH